MEKVIKFLGEVSHDDVVEEMKKVHLFVLASTTSKKGDQEGIPNVLKEAMATGLPVVSTKHAGIPELVRNGKSGVLVRERDATAMADELLHLIKNPHKWGKMGKAGRKIVKKSFHTPKQIGELENLYATILKKSR
ncbi:GDP-mannose-dependent alpha-(1-6)-phosphatidylinositol monomannoside mannosyltransferase [compost metagenome]